MDSTSRLKELIINDSWMMNVLRGAETLGLPDCWVSAGFIRNKVWDEVFQSKSRAPVNDIDVIYYDPAHPTEEIEKQYEKKLHKIMPGEPWSVKNQARMHVINGFAPYQSAADGMAHFPEQPTAAGARLKEGVLEISAPYGTEVLFSGIVAPAPYFKKGTALHPVYLERIQKKQWNAVWPGLQFI